MTIPPDTKDWTWVLGRRCPECDLDVADVPRTALPSRVGALAADWANLLRERPGTTTRPAPGVWSPLEYGCHVRDVLRICRGRVDLVLGAHEPVFPSWDQDATAVEQRYATQEPTRVAAELEGAARDYVAAVDGLPDTAWGRTGARGDGARFTVESLTRYVLHEIHHHLRDVSPG